MNEIPTNCFLVPVKLSKICNGWYREIRDDGLQKLEDTFRRAAGEGQDLSKGLVTSNPLLVYKLPRARNGFLFECIDGNHRLKLFIK